MNIRIHDKDARSQCARQWGRARTVYESESQERSTHQNRDPPNYGSKDPHEISTLLSKCAVCVCVWSKHVFDDKPGYVPILLCTCERKFKESSSLWNMDCGSTAIPIKGSKTLHRYARYLASMFFLPICWNVVCSFLCFWYVFCCLHAVKHRHCNPGFWPCPTMVNELAIPVPSLVSSKSVQRDMSFGFVVAGITFLSAASIGRDGTHQTH